MTATHIPPQQRDTGAPQAPLPTGVAAVMSSAAPRRPLTARPGSPLLDVVVPVYNEQDDLEPCVRRLLDYLSCEFPYSFRITVVDNASTDRTFAIAEQLQEAIPAVRAVHLEQKGRGRALRTAWSASDAAVLAYMDVDLSTDLAALLPLVAPLVSGHSDLAIGSRLSRSSRVVRGTKRELISRSYNLILRSTLAARFSDAQCGFKGIRADVARELLPLVEDHGWFFDTELLVLADRSGLRIHEVPVDWVDDPDSSVDILATAKEDLRGVLRLARALARGQLPVAKLRAQFDRDPLPAAGPALPGVPPRLARQAVRFGAIGVVSTLAYLILFSLLRGATGAQVANLVALLLTAVGNTAANRRLTFGVTGRRNAGRQQLEGLVVFGLGLALTSGALALLGAATATPSRLVELAVLVGANAAATVLRFLMFRAWVFHPSRGA